MVTRRALLLTNGGHARLPNNRAILEDIFRHQAGLDLSVSDDSSEMNRERLGRYDLLIDYSGHALVEPDDGHLQAVMDAVAAGTPYLGLHVASLPFRKQLEYRQAFGEWPADPQPNELLNETQLRYLEMIGSVFVGHGPITTFTVRITDTDHPITRGVTDFEIVDELYELAGDLSKAHLLAEADGLPLIYVSTWGQGKVHYNALGHDQRALSHPQNQRLILQGVNWLLMD